MRAYREKLYAKMQEVLADAQVDEQRILMEAAIYADKLPWMKKRSGSAAISISCTLF